MEKKNLASLSLGLILIFTASIKCNAENPQFYPNNTYGSIEKINTNIKALRESSWKNLSEILVKLSKIIINKPSISKSEVTGFEQLWIKSVTESQNKIKTTADDYIKSLDKLGAKSNFQNALYISEIKQLMNQDYNKFLLEKMSSAEFQIYTGFWKYNLSEYLHNPKIINADKTDFLYIQLKNYIARNLTKENKEKVMILISEMKKLGDSSITGQLMSLYNSTNNPEIRKAIMSMREENKTHQ